MKIYDANEESDSIEILLNRQELKQLVEALNIFENEANQFLRDNDGKKGSMFTHLHLSDCGLMDKESKSDIVFYLNLNE